MSALAAFGNRLIQRKRIQRHFIQRIRSRRGGFVAPFELEYRHIYILPGAFGFAFGGMLVFMALGGLNFNNSMALLLVFLLAAVAQLTTVLAYRNLLGMRVESVAAEPVFCGESAHFRVYLSNQESRPRLAIQLGAEGTQNCIDVPALGGNSALIHMPTERRGWCHLNQFRLETRYPLGLFKAWTWIFPSARCLVYPTPAQKPPRLPRTGHGTQGLAQKGEGDQVHGVRPYQQGDSPKRIAWRSSARHDALHTREMETPKDTACELRWDSLQGHAAEDRLSILTSWVLMADHRQLAYSLHLPGAVQPAARGDEHRKQCLTLLALHGL